MYKLIEYKPKQEPWNKGKLTGQKPPFKPQQIWAIRVRLQIDNKLRDLAMFNLAIDSKVRDCDLVKLRASDITQGGRVQSRAQVIQQKTQRPVQFEITDQARQSVEEWITIADLDPSDYLFPSRINGSPHVSARQYARIVQRWVSAIGLDPTAYGTHSLRRTKRRCLSTVGQRSFEPFRSCSGIPRWRVRSDISVSRLMTRLS